MMTRGYTAPGAGGGGGGGGAAPLTFEAAYGFANGANYYSGAAGTVQGDAAGFSAAAALRLRRKPSGREILFGTYSQFINGGWAIGYDGLRWKIMLTQASDGAKLENFVQAEFIENPYVLGKLVLLHFVFDGTTATLYVQGEAEATISPTGGITFDPTLGPHIGVEGRNQAEAAASAAALGCAYGTQVMTPAEVAEHYLEVMEAAAMVDDPGTGFDNLWTLDGETSAPATLTDQLGAVDLARTGALSLESRRPWYL